MRKWTKVRGVKIGTLGLLLSLGLVFLDVNTARAIEHPPLLIHCYTFILFPETLNPPTSLNLPLPEANAAGENDSVEVVFREPVSNDDIRRWIEVIGRQKKNIEARLEDGEYGPRSEPYVRASVSKIARTIAWLERIASGTNTENDPTITWGVPLVIFAGEEADDTIGIYSPARHEVVLHVDMETSSDSYSPAFVASVVAHEYSHSEDTGSHRPSWADVFEYQLAKLFDRPVEPLPKRDPTATGWDTEGTAYFFDALLYSNSDLSDLFTNQLDETTYAPLTDIQISEGGRKLVFLDLFRVDRQLSKDNDNPEKAMWIAYSMDPRSKEIEDGESAEISQEVNTSLITGGVSRGGKEIPGAGAGSLSSMLLDPNDDPFPPPPPGDQPTQQAPKPNSRGSEPPPFSPSLPNPDLSKVHDPPIPGYVLKSTGEPVDPDDPNSFEPPTASDRRDELPFGVVSAPPSGGPGGGPPGETGGGRKRHAGPDAGGGDESEPSSTEPQCGGPYGCYVEVYPEGYQE